ncbi:unnamed protein product, partial [Didymodactylos carnosus]
MLKRRTCLAAESGVKMGLLLILIIATLLLLQVETIHLNLSNVEEQLLYKNMDNREKFDKFFQMLSSSKDSGVYRMNSVNTSFARHNPNDIKNLSNMCFKSSYDLLDAFNITGKDLSQNDIKRLLPALASLKLNNDCYKPRKKSRLASKDILIGFICVTIVNLSAFGGIFILPWSKTRAFKWILTTLIGLDAGHSYLGKTLLTMLIICLLFMRDELLNIIFNIETNNEPITDSDIRRASIVSFDQTNKSKKKQNLLYNLKKMKQSGWLIFIGDLCHAFIDGLTLGAAFGVSLAEGLQMTVPILCEEFPHKLGDLAVLLTSGLTISQALLMNFISTCSCYLGFFIAIKLGGMGDFHQWIYALAGG